MQKASPFFFFIFTSQLQTFMVKCVIAIEGKPPKRHFMIHDLPAFVTTFFLATVVLTLVWIYLATRSTAFLLVCIAWGLVQSVIAVNGFYLVTNVFPPRLFI